MTKPPTLEQAEARRLLVFLPEKGIHTFSNGTHWECWASANCFECRHYDMDGAAGESCGFEGAALLGMVSPALALLFGWTESAKYPGSFSPPDSCRFFRSREDDDGDGPERPEDSDDPLQLVLLADPTEDAAQLTGTLTGAPPLITVGAA